MTVKWYGTAAISLEHNGTKLLFDPFVRMNKKLSPRISVDDFTHADAIFLSHGHFDHTMSVPGIEKKADIPVFATATPIETLKKKNVHTDRLNTIKPGDEITVGDFSVTALRGKHLVFDAKYLASIVPECIVTFPKFFSVMYKNITFPQNNEIICFDIKCDGKRILSMGSLGTVPNEKYPNECDLFVLPLGGRIAIYDTAAPIISSVNPKKIILTHYDNAFPPLTRRSDAEGIRDRILNDYAGVEVIIPEEKKDYIL